MKNINEDFSMEDFEAILNESFQKVYNGDVVEGRVLEITEQGLLVDVHSYMDGFLPIEELLYEGDSLENYKIGDPITVMIKHVDTRTNGSITLSKKAADTMVIWDDMEDWRGEQKVIDVRVLRAVKGGLVVSYQKTEGFMPASQISTEYVEDLEPYVGKTLRAVITDVDPDRKRFVASHKVVAIAEEKHARETKLASLKKGTVLSGKVVRLVPFGAFVEIAPHLDGLVHIGEMSWKRVKDPSEVVQVGDLVTVTVLSVDMERGRISLSLRESEADPWMNMDLKAGEVVAATIVKTIDSGVFAEIADGIEGFIPVSQISEKKVTRVGAVLDIGQEVNVKIMQIDPEQKRISLSIRAALEEAVTREKDEIIRNYHPDDDAVSTNLGSLLSGFMYKK